MPTIMERSVAMEEPDRFLTVVQVARWLNMHKKTIYRKVERGEIPAYWIDGMWRFKQNEVEEWLKAYSNQHNDQAEKEV